MRFIFFALGVPMMIMSFFQVTDALPFVQSQNLFVNGHEIVLTETEQADLKQQIETLFENSHTLPALGVVFDNEFKTDLQDGIFVSLKFDVPIEINDLPLDELWFRVSPEAFGFNLCRANHGIVQGRCIYVDLNGKTMQNFSDFVNSLPQVQEKLAALPNVQEEIGSSQQKIASQERDEIQLQQVAEEGQHAENEADSATHSRSQSEEQNENKNPQNLSAEQTQDTTDDKQNLDSKNLQNIQLSDI